MAWFDAPEDLREKAIKVALPLIKEFEGLKLEPHQCSAKVWTIGYGKTILPDNTPVSEKTAPITEDEAEEFLRMDAEKFCNNLLPFVKTEINANQLAALISFCYNLGVRSFRKSTLLKKLNAEDFEGCANEFGRWVFANKKRLLGLELRRRAERNLFEKNEGTI